MKTNKTSCQTVILRSGIKSVLDQSMMKIMVGIFLYHLYLLLAVEGVSNGEMASHGQNDGSGETNLEENDPSAPYQCGGWLDGPHGYFHTPHFPRVFPTPLECRWVVHAPPGKKIILYFTQFYIRASFTLEEYKYYKDDYLYVEKTELGQVNFDDYYSPFEALKPYLVIRFHRQDIGHIHYRVDEFFVDVFGFNITYEIVDKNAGFRADHCSIFQCSFLGDCFASRHFDSYRCHCYPNYHGNECQLGPYCNPALDINLCDNGGRCRYFLGSSVNTCDCPPGYSGAQCQDKIESYIDQECGALGCNQKCVKTDSGDQYQCACHSGYRLLEDNKICVENGRMRYYGQVRIEVGSGYTICQAFTQTFVETVSQEIRFGFPEFQDFKVLYKSSSDPLPENGTVEKFLVFDSGFIEGYLYIDFYFIGDKVEPNLVWGVLITMLEHNITVCDLVIDPDYMVYDPQLALHSVNLHNYENHEVIEGQLLTLVCKAKGSKGLEFQWQKDDVLMDTTRTRRNIWETRIPNEDGETHTSVLNIEETDHLDEGTFQCRVSDWGEVVIKSLYVRVVPVPVPELFPVMATVADGGPITLSCLSRDDEQANFIYRWQVNDEAALWGLNEEVVEDVLPTGTRLILQKVRVSANYTCIVSSRAGVARRTSVVIRVDPRARFCEPETVNNTQWQLTANGMWDMQPCPADAKGWASRACDCQESQVCKWSSTNYHNCTTFTLRALYREVTMLSLGYQVYTVNQFVQTLLDQVDQYGYLYLGDVSLMMKILKTLLLFTKDYLKKDTLMVEGIIRLVNTSIVEAMKWSDRTPRIPEKVMEIITILSTNRYIYTQAEDTPMGFQTPVIDFNIISVSGGQKSRSLIQQEKFDVYFDESQHFTDNATMNITVTSYKESEYFEYTEYTRILESTIVSPIITVIVMQSLTLVEGKVDVRPYYVRFHHPFMIDPRLTSIQCVILDVGLTQWRPEDTCTLMSNDKASTVCKCYGPNHIALMVKQTVIEAKVEEIIVPIRIIRAAAIMSLVVFVFILASQICLARKSLGKQMVVQLQFTVILIIINSLLLGGFFTNTVKILCQAIKMMLLILYAAAETMMLNEAIQLYQKYKAKKAMNTVRQATILAVLLTFLAILLGSIGSEQGLTKVHQVCWIAYSDWEMYAFIVIIGIILLFYCVFISLVAKCICQRYITKSAACEKRIKAIMAVSRCFVSFVLLTGSIICSVLLATYPHELLYHYVFAGFHCLLGSNIPPGSIRTFVPQKAMQNSRRYSDIEEALIKRNSLKYTKERKEQLIALLGTGSPCHCKKPDGVCSCIRLMPSVPSEKSKLVQPLRGRCFITDDTRAADNIRQQDCLLSWNKDLHHHGICEKDEDTSARNNSNSLVPFPELENDDFPVKNCNPQKRKCRGGDVCLCVSMKRLSQVEDCASRELAIVSFKHSELCDQQISPSHLNSSNLSSKENLDSSV